MSPRTFARRFLASTGTTPVAWLVRERIRLAQRLLETSDLPVEVVARDSGFGSPDNLRKHFRRTLGTTPQGYRKVFREPEVSKTDLADESGEHHGSGHARITHEG